MDRTRAAGRELLMEQPSDCMWGSRLPEQLAESFLACWQPIRSVIHSTINHLQVPRRVCGPLRQEESPRSICSCRRAGPWEPQEATGTGELGMEGTPRGAGWGRLGSQRGSILSRKTR